MTERAPALSRNTNFVSLDEAPLNGSRTPSKGENITVRSPFGYFGSKLRMARKIIQDLPPHNAWIDAFCGSAVITLSKLPAPIEIINDKDHEIVNFFEQLRDQPAQLCRAIALTPYAAQELLSARESDVKVLKLERARRFAVSAMMAINGAFGEAKGGFSRSPSYARAGMEARVSRWCNLPDRLAKVAERLKGLRIENRDAVELLEDYLNRPATLIYLDPPYLAERSRGYNHDAHNWEFHRGLLELVCRAKCMVLISGYDSELYRGRLRTEDGWRSTTFKTHTRGVAGKVFERTEVIWKNKYYVYAKQTGRVPIALTNDEKKWGKVNPVRHTFLVGRTGRVS